MDYRIRNSSYDRIPDNVVPTMVDYPIIRDNREFGSVATSMIVDKFEETNMGYEDELYDHYARDTLMDQRPDQNKFECEDARPAVNQRYGMLQLRHHGTRGEIDNPYRPEIFIGFGGVGDADPRGIAVEPDFKELRKQEEARMRFIRFDKDDSNFVVDGPRAERRVIEDNQAVHRITRDRLRVFSRQIDGRTPSKSATKHDPISNVCRQVVVQSYGDYITDKSLTPQRKATLMCDKIIRDTNEYRDNATDQDMDYARYTRFCKSAPCKQENKVNASIGQQAFASSDKSRQYRALSIRMKDICNARSNLMTDPDTDMSASRDASKAAKTAPIRRDILLITQSIKQDGDFSQSDNTTQSKSAKQQHAQTIKNVTNDRHLNDMHYNNAIIIKKAAEHGDLRAAKNAVDNDHVAQAAIDDQTAGKSASNKTATGARLKRDYDADTTESHKTHQYRGSNKLNRESKKLLDDGHNFGSQSDDSQATRKSLKAHDTIATGKGDEDSHFLDNYSSERHGAGLGTKYTHSYSDRDGRSGAITD